ncbi:hypothetical protein MUK42_33453 [Musa troglodytarum]|uniref:Uncharacterized protein n=1 Tax=Musa troglodytarum TaxID=320322 RepID=A0A9E7F9R5_9LILI|nr:hypothetical protein MUK42_33453 [Musa troglodytarum]
MSECGIDEGDDDSAMRPWVLNLMQLSEDDRSGAHSMSRPRNGVLSKNSDGYMRASFSLERRALMWPST